MKDEIKEILEGIEVVIKHDGTLEFNTKELKILLDYITNLQEENERLKENAIHNDKVVDKARWNEMIYKTRNEKAREILHNINDDLPLDLILSEIEHSEYVLQGSD